MKTREAPYTEPYVRCCGRSVDKIIIYLLHDCIVYYVCKIQNNIYKVNKFAYVKNDIICRHIQKYLYLKFEITIIIFRNDLVEEKHILQKKVLSFENRIFYKNVMGEALIM